MPAASRNTQMFALSAPPPEKIRAAGTTYRLRRVFKHDFWAATCLYERCEADGRSGVSGIAASPPPSSEIPFPKIVVKFGRQQGFWGLPLTWAGRMLADHEQSIYAALTGVAGVPRWVGRLAPTCYAVEYIEARPLDHFDEKIPPGFFDRLRMVFDAMHARGIAYGDANKKSNLLVQPDGEPAVIDFQISLRRRDDLFPPLRGILRRVVAYLQNRDLYHLYKHKRRLAPAELTAEEDALSRQRTGLHALHRTLTKPYRALRRRFLQRQYRRGRLVSPTAALEDHPQPEKASWRDAP